MYLNKTRGYHKRMRRLSGFLSDNSVLALGLGVTLAISTSFTVQSALCVMAGMWVVTLPVMLLASLVGRRLPAWSRMPLYALCAMLLLLPVESVLAAKVPLVMDSLGVYFPIIAVNTLTLYRSQKKHVDAGPLRALMDGLLQLLGFSLVMLVAASVREVFGNGTFAGFPVRFITFKLGGLLVPFAGCILLAFMAAASKYVGRLMRVAFYSQDLKKALSKQASEEKTAE